MSGSLPQVLADRTRSIGVDRGGGSSRRGPAADGDHPESIAPSGGAFHARKRPMRHHNDTRAGPVTRVPERGAVTAPSDGPGRVGLTFRRLNSARGRGIGITALAATAVLAILPPGCEPPPGATAVPA